MRIIASASNGFFCANALAHRNIAAAIRRINSIVSGVLRPPAADVSYSYGVMRHVVPRNEPMSEAVFFLILSSLAAEPRHGYAILQDVEALTSGCVRLSTGTLYGALRRLLAEGSIRRVRGEPGYARPANVRSHRRGTTVVAAEMSRDDAPSLQT